jgi:hypothetical protein
VTASSTSTALTQRLRVLLRASPLFATRQSDGRIDPELRHYDSLLVSLRIFDLIVERMGLDHELDVDGLAEALGPLAQAMDRAADRPPDVSRHRRLVERVVAALRNDEHGRRTFEIDYPSVEEDGRIVDRQLRFRLLQDRFHPAGGTVLELSTDAINLYLGALEHDLEDAQAATEAVIQSQIARGRLEDAAHSARQARWQSLRFTDKVDRLLRDTRRDVASVDWGDDTLRLLDGALTHLSSRLEVERHIVAAAGERLDLLPDDHARRASLVAVVDLVRECELRHLELHGRLLGARSVFLDEQGRQRFVPAARRLFPDLAADVLRPLLAMSAAGARTAVEPVDCLVLGAVAPAQLSLRGLVAHLLRPRRERPSADVETVPEDFTSGADDLAFLPEEARSEALRRLTELRQPVTLSALLTELAVEGASAATRLAVALVTLRQFAPEASSALPRVSRIDRALVTEGFEGDELQLAPAATDAP